MDIFRQCQIPSYPAQFAESQEKALHCDLFLQYRTPGVRGIYHLRKVFLCAFSVVRQPIHIVQISPAYFALNLDVIRSSVLYCTQQNGRWGRMGFQPFSPLPPLRANSPGCLLCYHHNLGGYPPWFSLTLPRSPLFKWRAALRPKQSA